VELINKLMIYLIMIRYPRVAVGGIIIKEKKILLVLRRDEPDRNKWAIPGGKLELNETIEEGLKREMKEELSVDIEVRELAGISEFISLNFHYIIIDYICNPLGENIKTGSDALDAAYFDLENLGNTVNDSTREFIKKLNSSEKPVHIINRKF
jgi:8-oxo-dGTP diphosphatase